MTTNAQLASLVRGLEANVDTLNKRMADHQKIADEVMRMKDLIKPEYQAQAEARDAVRQCKHFETVIKNFEARLGETSVAQVSDKTTQIDNELGWMKQCVYALESDVANLKHNVPNLHTSLETAVKRLTGEVQEIQTFIDNSVPLNTPSFVHARGCFKAGDDVRKSCPECKPTPAAQVCTTAKLHNQQLAWADMAEEVYDYISRQVGSFEGEDEPSEREGKNLLCRLAYVVQPKVAALSLWAPNDLSQYVSDALSGSTWSNSKFPGVKLDDVLEEIQRRAGEDE